jgi:hypothetical protein
MRSERRPAGITGPPSSSPRVPGVQQAQAGGLERIQRVLRRQHSLLSAMRQRRTDIGGPETTQHRRAMM